MSILDNYYFKIFAIDMGIQWGAWGIAAYLQTEKFYDITGNGSLINNMYVSVMNNQIYSFESS